MFYKLTDSSRQTLVDHFLLINNGFQEVKKNKRRNLLQNCFMAVNQWAAERQRRVFILRLCCSSVADTLYHNFWTLSPVCFFCMG